MQPPPPHPRQHAETGRRAAPASAGRDEAPLLILAHGERVRVARLTTPVLGAVGATALVLAAWLVGVSAYLMFHDNVREAAGHYLTDKHRSYEENIATLRRQIDEINGRQFLDQTSVERKLEALRQRQASLEARQARIGDLMRGARARNVSIEVERPVSAARSVVQAGPLIGTRPRPEAETAALAGFRPATDPTERIIEAIDTSLSSLVDAQNAALAALEDSLGETFGKLAAVSEAVDAPPPVADMEEAEFGTGGPLIELRGLSLPMPADDQIARLETALDQFDTLKSHVRALPVRRPIEGNARISSGYGTRLDPFLRRPALHTGIDFRARRGTPVLAAGAGTVTIASYSGGYGNLVEIDHGNGYSTRYAHLHSISVSAGDDIDGGTLIGKVGSTGRSTGPHLHYETRRNGQPRNPAAYVEAARLVPEGF